MTVHHLLHFGISVVRLVSVHQSVVQLQFDEVSRLAAYRLYGILNMVLTSHVHFLGFLSACLMLCLLPALAPGLLLDIVDSTALATSLLEFDDFVNDKFKPLSLFTRHKITPIDDVVFDGLEV